MPPNVAQEPPPADVVVTCAQLRRLIAEMNELLRVLDTLLADHRQHAASRPVGLPRSVAEQQVLTVWLRRQSELEQQRAALQSAAEQTFAVVRPLLAALDEWKDRARN